MSKPTPPHHKTVEISRAQLAKGYGGEFVIPHAGPGLWIIVAASPTDEAPGSGPKPWLVSVIVAPARVPT